MMEPDDQHRWKLLNDNGSLETRRMRVPGGWLYLITRFEDTGTEWHLRAENAVFVPFTSPADTMETTDDA